MTFAPCALPPLLNNRATIWFDAWFKFASSPGGRAGDIMDQGRPPQAFFDESFSEEPKNNPGPNLVAWLGASTDNNP
jgi:hypothetical protein